MSDVVKGSSGEIAAFFALAEANLRGSTYDLGT